MHRNIIDIGIKLITITKNNQMFDNAFFIDLTS